jgi:hypothetical protein
MSHPHVHMFSYSSDINDTGESPLNNTTQLAFHYHLTHFTMYQSFTWAWGQVLMDLQLITTD